MHKFIIILLFTFLRSSLFTSVGSNDDESQFDSEPFSVMTLNLNTGSWNQTSWEVRKGKVVSMLNQEKPDVLVLQGVRKTATPGTSELEDILGAVDNDLFVNGTFSFTQDGDSELGVAILSRFLFHPSSRAVFHSLTWNTSKPIQKRIIKAVVNIANRPVQIYTVEFPYDNQEILDTFTNASLTWIEKQGGSNESVIWAGDFGIREYRDTEKELMKFEDAWEHMDPSLTGNEGVTIESEKLEKGRPDRILFSNGIAFKNCTVIRTEATQGWPHFPVVAFLRLKKPKQSVPTSAPETTSPEPSKNPNVKVTPKQVIVVAFLLGAAILAAAILGFCLWKRSTTKAKSKEYYRPLEIDVFTIGDLRTN